MSTTSTGNGTVGLIELNQTIPPGIVTQAFLTVDDVSIGPAALWGSLIIKDPTDSESTPLYILTSGYFSLLEPLVWNGFLSLDSSSEIQANIVGQRNGTVFLNYRRLTQLNINEVGKFLRDILRA